VRFVGTFTGLQITVATEKSVLVAAVDIAANADTLLGDDVGA
jgi:hypothetical protein